MNQTREEFDDTHGNQLSDKVELCLVTGVVER